MDSSLNNEIKKIKNCCSSDNTLAEWEELAGKVKKLYRKYDLLEDIAIEYLCILLEIAKLKEDKTELRLIASEAKEIYENHEFCESAASDYIGILLCLSYEQETKEELQVITAEANRVYEKHEFSESVSVNYAGILLCLSRFQETESELKVTAAEAKKVYENHKVSESIAIDYTWIRYFLSTIQKSKRGLAETVCEAKRVFDNYQNVIEIGKAFTFVLENLSKVQTKKSELKQTSETIKFVYEKLHNPEELAGKYMKVLFQLSKTQKKESDLESTAAEAKQVYDQHPANSSRIQWYMGILVVLTKKQKDLNRLYSTTEKICEILLTYDRLINIVEKYIDRLINPNDDVTANDVNYCVRLLMSFGKQGEEKNPLMRTKYNFLFDACQNVAEGDMKKLIKILSKVQEIKNYLIVKNPSELEFGHYTSGKVLQKFLEQKDNNKGKYAIETSSRLNNVNYMNDPSEGKVIDQFLGVGVINQKLSLKPSPWFLMSLTTAIDQLTMWSQYGDRAEGVCLVLDSGDFSTVQGSSGVEWFTNKKTSINVNNDDVEGITQKNTESKDFIYRIGYLSKQDNKEFLLKKEHNSHLDVDEINKLLIVLKEIVIDINKESSLYEKVDECLEEIRYLFKSADYSYESELRVLKYMPLEPDNSKIKIDDKGKYAKLYIERDNPIQISEVIFGPKFQNPENVTPLLYLLDKNIKFRQSEISFR